jgi:hypothetical protein
MRASRKKRKALVMEKVIEKRRGWWSEAAAWIAYALHQSGDEFDWRDFYAIALALSQGRPLHEIALTKCIAEQTIEAAEFHLRVA